MTDKKREEVQISVRHKGDDGQKRENVPVFCPSGRMMTNKISGPL